MAFENDWSHRAASDLKRIVEYYDAHDPDWTDAVLASIMDKLDFLSTSPFLAAIHKLTPWGEVRVALAGSYQIFFRVNEAEQVIRIESVRHVRQQDPEFPE